MTYQVLARKWRPALFEEVVGQEHVVRTLTNAIGMGRIGHAYLFSGPRGVGKTTVARILAKCLNCEQGPTARPCGECNLCTGITKGSLVDVLEIDGASNTSVDNVRELRESVRYAPAQARYKVYIIDEVHMLSDSAFNALLKTLEEPPPHVVFVFATTEPHKIPATIHSRCQRFDFKRIALKMIHSHLQKIAINEGVKIDDDALYLIARESEGGLRDAQSLLEQVISFSGATIGLADVTGALGVMDRSVIFDLSTAMVKKDTAECLNIVEKIHDFGYDFKKVTVGLLENIRDLVVTKVTADAGKALTLDVTDQEADRLKELSEMTGLERLQMLFSVLGKGLEQVIRSSTPRFSFEMMLVKASMLEDVRDVGELIAELEALSGRRRSFAPGSDDRGGPGPGVQSSRNPAQARQSGAKEQTGSPVCSDNAALQPKAAPKVDSNTAQGGDTGTADEGRGLHSANAAQDRHADSPPANSDKKDKKNDTDGSVSGFKAFAGDRNKRIFEAIDTVRLTPDRATLIISIYPEKFSFIEAVKKDDLIGLAKEYFKEFSFHIDIIKSGEGSGEEAVENSGVAGVAGGAGGTDAPGSESNTGAGIENGANDVNNVNNKGKSTRPDPVLRQALVTLGGKVIR